MIKMNKSSIGTREIFNVNKLLLKKSDSNDINYINKFESEFTELIKSKFSIAVNSGTSALHLSLLALGIGPGDEVIIPVFSFAATANCVLLTGAKIVFADIDPKTYNIDTASLETKITRRTKAIIPVHLYGLSADMVTIMKIARKYKIFIVEDAAQAHGAELNGKKVGSFGATGAFSFYYTKNISTFEGGMVTTSNSKILNLIKLLRNQGMAKTYFNVLPGYNNRLTQIQALIGTIQLSKLTKSNMQRRKNASLYDQELKGVLKPYVPNGYYHVYNQYTIQVTDLDRSKFQRELLKLGIETKVYYPLSLNKLPYLKSKLNYKHAEICSSRVLSLPIRPNLKNSELERVIKAVNKIAEYGT